MGKGGREGDGERLGKKEKRGKKKKEKARRRKNFSSSITFLRKLNKPGSDLGKERYRVKRKGRPEMRDTKEFQDEGEGGHGMAHPPAQVGEDEG